MSNEEARLKEAKKRLERLNRVRSESIGELKQVDQNLKEMGIGTDPKDIDKWLKEKGKKLDDMEQKSEKLLEELEEVLDGIENI